MVPYLNLPSNKQGNVNLWDFKQKKNLVIFFYHGISCVRCKAKLKEIADAYSNIQSLEAEVLAVSFDGTAETADFAKKKRLRFPLLSDLIGDDTASFTYIDESRKAPYPSLFITDRYGALRYQEIAEEADSLPSVKEILDWLLLIQTECPECSHL